MLIQTAHESFASSGVAVANAKITNRTVLNGLVFIPTHSGVKFGLDGQLFTVNPAGGFNPVSGEWLITGTAASFFLQRTIISGSLETDAGTGFLQLNADRTFENIKSSAGAKTTVVFFEISSDVSGVPVVATATHTYISQQGFDFI